MRSILFILKAPKKLALMKPQLEKKVQPHDVQWSNDPLAQL